MERKQQHLLSIARALQIQAQIPIQFWGDCVLIVAYLINRLPSPFLNDKTHFELLFRRPLDYNHLKVFGCLCFASTIPQTRNKFSPRAIKCVIGYPFNIKGYKLFDLESHTIFVSRDIIFHESIFPYVSNSCEFDPHPSLPLPCVPAILIIFDDTILPKAPPFAIPQDSIIQVHHILDDNFLDEVPEEPLELLVDPVLLRMSSRPIKQPSYLQAYHCNRVSSVIDASPTHLGTSHPLSSHVSYQHLCPSYKTFCCSISSIVKPTFYYKVVSNLKWQKAMAAAIATLEANNTWTLTPLPAGEKLIT